MIFKSFFILTAFKRVHSETKEKYKILSIKTSKKLKRQVFELLLIFHSNSYLINLNNFIEEFRKIVLKRKEKSRSFLEFYWKKKFLVKWLKAYHFRQNSRFSMIQNKLAIEFLFERILSLRYSGNIEKLHRKQQKYFQQWNKKDKAMNCLMKVNFI